MISCSEDLGDASRSVKVPRDVVYYGYEVLPDGLSQSALYKVSSDSNHQNILNLSMDLSPLKIRALQCKSTVLIYDRDYSVFTYNLATGEAHEDLGFPVYLHSQSDNSAGVSAITENSAAGMVYYNRGQDDMYFYRLPHFHAVQRVPSFGERVEIGAMEERYYAKAFIDDYPNYAIKLLRWSDIESSPDKEATLTFGTNISYAKYARWHLFDDAILLFTDADSLFRLNADLELLGKEYADFDTYSHLAESLGADDEIQYEGRYLSIGSLQRRIQVPVAIDLETLERSAIIDSEAIHQTLSSNSQFAGLETTDYAIDFDNELVIFGLAESPLDPWDPERTNNHIVYVDFRGNIIADVPTNTTPLKVFLP